jgi:hypothetical protein
MDHSSLSDKEHFCTIEADDSGIVEQLEELRSYFKGEIPDALLDDLGKLLLDLVTTDVTATLEADESFRYVIRPRFGLSFEALIAAIRAGYGVFHASS